MHFYLASTSPARLALLRSAGLDPITIASHVDEAAAVRSAAASGPLTPTETVQLLARAKAEAVAARDRSDDRDGLVLDGLVLGGDSMFELDGAVHGKPHTPERARERWRSQRGRTGTLHSGHWLIDARRGGTGRSLGAVASAEVTFADLDDDEVEAYIASGEPLEVAGAFTIDSLGGPFIRSVVGDPSTVVGLSLSTLRDLVRGLGVAWTDLWTASS